MAQASPAGSASAAAHSGLADATSPNTQNSRYDAGYGGYDVRGSTNGAGVIFTVPKLSCTTSTRGISPSAGVSNADAALLVYCIKGREHFVPALTMGGKETNYKNTVKAGNVVSIGTSVTSSGTKVTFSDLTRKFTVKKSGARLGSTTYGYLEDTYMYFTHPTIKVAGVPDFGTINFTHARMSGHNLGAVRSTKFNRVNSKGQLQISTSPILSKGTAFKTYFKHS